MKSNLRRIFFEWALITSMLMSVGFFVVYCLKSHQLRRCQSQIAIADASINQNHVIMGRLLQETQEYAKTNADLARVLASLQAGAAGSPAASAPRKAAAR